MDQLLHDFGYFGENVICNYARQITHGIVFLHENGIIHRDLKGTYVRPIRGLEGGVAWKTPTIGLGSLRALQ